MLTTPITTHLIAALAGAGLALAIVVPAMGHHQNAVAIAAERQVSAAVVSAHQRVRAVENEAQHNITAISNLFELDLTHEKNQHAAVVAGLRAGNLRLHIPTSACIRDATASTAGSASGDHEATTTAELSGSAAEDLLGLVADADEVAIQLRACQAVLVADRAMFSNAQNQKQD
jgi:hypothetical protein